MNPIPKFLIVLGVVLIVIGVIWLVAGRFFPLGRLPGDIVIEKEHVRFYFPVVTCLVLSVVVSLVLYVVRLFWK